MKSVYWVFKYSNLRFVFKGLNTYTRLCPPVVINY